MKKGEDEKLIEEEKIGINLTSLLGIHLTQDEKREN